MVCGSPMRRSSGCGLARSAEGPAWNAQGHYLVWSVIANNRQLRWLEDDGRVSVFRMPSNNSNGNTFDYQGRRDSCEHLTRRVVHYQLDGSATVIADYYGNSKRLNSPNDAVPHPTAASGSPTHPMEVGCMRVGARCVWRIDEPGRQAQSAARSAGGI